MEELVYGKDYHLFLQGRYIGKATFTDDENNGDCFIRTIIDEKGELIYEVYRPDAWTSEDLTEEQIKEQARLFYKSFLSKPVTDGKDCPICTTKNLSCATICTNCNHEFGFN